MKRLLATIVVVPWLVAFAPPAKTLDIYFIDVEGGQSTLMITPAGESLLIDAGYAGRGGRGQLGTSNPAPNLPPRDPTRILATIREARVDRLDYLLVTHFHPDHVGGVPEVAAQIPIGTFIDYGLPLGTDRMTAGGFRAYEPIRATHRHIQPRPGDRLPLKGLRADVVSSGGMVLSKPMRGAGQPNDLCATVEDEPDDGTENFRSIGVMFQFGAFRFLDLGDLSGNLLADLVCPQNLLGRVSAYLIAHHGDDDASVPAVYAALRPRVAIMNNSATRGGAPFVFKILRALPWIDVWQLHASRRVSAENSPDDLIANVDDGATSYSLKLSASEDGSFRVVNARTGFSKSY